MLRTLSIPIFALLLEVTASAQGLAFDAASVKLLSPGIPKAALYSGGPGTTDPGRLHLRLNMSQLLVGAFAVTADQIKGPSWTRDFSAMPFYDIVATLPPDTTKQQLEEMLRNLLTERFHLAFHREKGSFPGYELVVNQRGPKLKEVTPDPDPAPGPHPASSASLGADGFPIVPGRRKLRWRPSTAHLRIKYQEWSMASFASDLGSLIARSLGKSLDDGFLEPRVVDKTGLPGKYTFILEYECPPCASAPSTAPNEPAFPDIFGAVQEQLGLKLNPASALQLDVIVVSTLDKIPAAN